MIGRGTGARSDVVKVERSLVGVPSVWVVLHCGFESNFTFESLKPVLFTQSVVHSVKIKF